MKIAICEDEMICTDILETHIRKWATDNGIWVEVFTYESAEQFLFYLNENAETDLLFLDIKLGGINGVELAKKLRGMKHTMQIVFTTDTENIAKVFTACEYGLRRYSAYVRTSETKA